MRVISGSAKNKSLLVPEKGTRPLTDRIKMSLFDLLQPYLKDAAVLDLFAGSGGFGIESLSRGAKTVAFVDSSEVSTSLILQNLQNTGFELNGTIHLQDAGSFLSGNRESFDIIFLDPPFSLEHEKLVELVTKSGLNLTKEGVLIVRQPHSGAKTPVLTPGGGLEQVYQKRYGKSLVSFYRN